MGRADGFVVEETDVREQGAATVERSEQQDVPLAGMSSRFHAALQKRRQGIVHFIGNIGCRGTQIVVKSQYFLR